DLLAAGARESDGYGHECFPSKNELRRLTAAGPRVKAFRSSAVARAQRARRRAGSRARNWPAARAVAIVSRMRFAAPTTKALMVATAAVAAAALGLGAAVSAPGAARAQGRHERRFSIVYTAEVHGAIEPCGCTSDPLGDISRLASVVAAARKETGAVLLVDGGGLLHAEGGVSARERTADDLRAAFLATEFEKLGLAGAALAETDLTGGVDTVRPKRLASNIPTSSPAAAGVVRPPEIKVVGGVKVGLLGVA